MRIRRAIVRPGTGFLPITDVEVTQGGTIGPEAAGHDLIRATMRPQGFLQELQRGHLVTRLRHEALGYLPFGIDRPPKIVPLTVDRHEDLVEVPPPVARPHPRNPPLADPGCNQRTKSGPPEPDGLMADVVSSRVQQVLDGTK